jgi:two-component system, cell cycle response regulator DivK
VTGERILVVDDNPTNLKLAVDVLEFAGYEVLRATNAEEAEALVCSTRVDLILMDIQMPGMDGLTLTRKLKAGSEANRIPIIAMTSFAMKGDEQRARNAGCDGYLAKPIDTRKLPEQVADFLRVSDTE